MRMTAEQMSAYPSFAKYVRNEIPKTIRNKKVLEAVKNHSGADEKTIIEGVTWGHGPLVNAVALVPQQRDGKTYYPTGGYTLHSNKIDFSLADVGRFQQGSDMRDTAHGKVHLATIILLHELTHWAREKSNTEDSPDVEDGFEFEKEAYGSVIER